MAGAAPTCAYCGYSELEVFTPQGFAGMTSGEPSLWCPQCLHHNFPGGNTASRVIEFLPALSFAGYAEEPPPGRFHLWWNSLARFFRRQTVTPNRIPAANLATSVPVRRRA